MVVGSRCQSCKTCSCTHRVGAGLFQNTDSTRLDWWLGGWKKTHLLYLSIQGTGLKGLQTWGYVLMLRGHCN